ncbi:methyltransferase [Bacillus coahuilensis m2-6]|uniref:class I SAM-dependent DNA methyltransferase n=1 Tax=Bacillus coahuilensis TaxID=408580 RepID=UPI0007505FBE|nr:class I SAM-dependent methyltransferase [Bacillus coahuilensis]KUP07259.1 methyltransferase [Bacillus coahuilensis m2-6]
MSYHRFSFLYDELMQDAPYDLWLSFTKSKVENGDLKEKAILDLACGTGEMSIRFAKEGMNVTGVDLSETMLMVAKDKTNEANVSVDYYQQDMKELEGLSEFDLVVLYCDSLNYLSGPRDVLATFKRIYDHLKPGGMLLFDVHSPFKVDELFIDQSFSFAGEEISYIWDSFAGEEPHSVIHELTFFVKEDNGLYERVEETHEQRTFPIADYTNWLREVGYSSIEVTGDFTEHVTETSERLFFSCKK